MQPQNFRRIAVLRKTLIALLISLACAEEFRGSSSDPSTFKQAKQSSTAYLEGALTSADKAVDGDTGGHLYFSAGCAITEWEANPWWRVDLGSLIPMAVCASDIALQTVGVTAVNCFAGGRFVFIGGVRCVVEMGAVAGVKTRARAVGLPTPVTSGCGDASTAQPMPAALAMAAKAVAPLEQVQRIFAERSKELNTALGEMEVKVNSLMRTPEKSPQLSWEHRCAVAVGERSGEGADSANLREHACWLWSRLGLSLMSLEDRNAMLEEENKRLEQDLELLEQQIRETKSAIKGHSSASSHTPHPRAPPPLDTDEVLSSPMEASALTTPTQSTTSPKNATAAASAHRAPAPASSANVTTPPTSVPSSISAPALGVEFLKMGFYKMCWCSGMFSCVSGADFNFLIGFGVITGREMRTIAGNGTDPVRNVDEWEERCHAVDLVGNMGHVCGDGLPGTMARLHDPRGLAVCRGELLIADYLNSRIRAYDLTTGIITTKVGSDHGYAGDGGAPHQAKLSGPAGVVCDELRGYWIADTGNSAIRGVRVTPGQSDVITTVVGGLGQGAVQQVIGTGSTGHVTSVGGKNIQLNRPEGVAVHSSTAFVADTMNHRIIMVPILEYEPLGCFKEVTVEGESTLVPTLEGDMEAGLSPAEGPCGEEMLDVNDAVARCAHATMRKAPTPRSAQRQKPNDAHLCRSKGGHYAGYSCKVVSWDDVSRGTGPSGLSCWGANITDTYLKSRSGTPLFTLRADNWNERLGIIDAQRVALVAPGAPGLSAPGEAPTLRPVTLQRVLKEMGRYGHYAGLASDVDLSDALRDTKCSIRFQTTFLPVEASDTRPAVLEFATESWSVWTRKSGEGRGSWGGSVEALGELDFFGAFGPVLK
eukprot:g3018.t1